MPEITIYTNDGDCANGVAEINPFTVGDATDDWTLKFNNGTDFYAPSNVTMRVGHTNGLPDGNYSNAFKWVDRADNKSTGSITVSGGVPALSFDSNPAGGVVGGNGVYILRGPELDGSLLSLEILYEGSESNPEPGPFPIKFTPDRFCLNNVGNSSNEKSNPPTAKFEIEATEGMQLPVAQGTTVYSGGRSYVSSIAVISGGKNLPSTLHADAYEWVSQPSTNDSFPSIRPVIALPKYEFPFKRDESGNNIIAATTLSPYSDGQVTGVAEYDHSTLVIRPETVATASLTQSGTDWVGTMNPINSYVTERLALRNSTQLDIQIRGDGRTLFQGQLTILNKIA
jgi:hypothetical protein